MQKEGIREYYLNRDFNCAETTLRVLNDRFGLNLGEEDFKLVGGFGGGCGCGIICGTLAGIMAAMGKMMITTQAHATPDFKETCGEFCRRFEECLGSTSCCEIKPRYFKEDARCLEAVEAAVDCFEAFVKEKGLR